MTSHVDWNRMDGFARVTDSGPDLTEASLEATLVHIAQHRQGYGFMYFRRAYLRHVLPPRQFKKFVSLYEGDRLVGQLMVVRDWNAHEPLPFVERIHPDDEVKASRRWQSPVPPAGVRV